MIRKSFRESERCAVLVIMKGLLWRISHRDGVLLSRMTGQILVSTRSGDLVFSLLNLGRGSIVLEAWSPFPDVCTRKK